MRNHLLPEAEQYTRQTRRRRIWQKIVGTLACIVVFCTTYALILPAITMEKEFLCGMEEHTHGEGCHVQNAPMLNCTYASLGVHTHSTECAGENGEWICGCVDYIAHEHDTSCYDEAGGLICQLPEITAHKHTEECYPAENAEAGHTHGESCWTVQQGALCCGYADTGSHSHSAECYEQQLVCSQPEDTAHTHTETCHEDTLICGQEEASTHEHTAECYEQVKQLVCGLTEEQASDAERIPVCGEVEVQTHVHSASCFAADTETPVCGLEEHTHSLACHSDVTADVETAENWEAGFADVELTGKWAEDAAAIAMTQIGYKESTRNFQVLEDGGTIRGYIRYGAWYGDPYGDWCAMFASFCLHYAGVEEMPLDSSCQNWIVALMEQELYHTADTYTPDCGDLIFFDWDEDGTADHVGIVAEIIPATETGSAAVKTIEGNIGDCVAEQEYALDDSTILGYGALPVQEAEETYLCGLEEHNHDESCMDESETLVCGKEEHIHSVECSLPLELSEEERTAVADVIRLIEPLPTYDEIMAKLDEFYEADDTEGEEAYLTEVYAQVETAYRAYMALSEELRAYATNADKLMELEFIWSQITLEEEVYDYSALPYI